MPITEPHRELVVLSTVATVIAIVGGVWQIADFMLEWHDRWRRRGEHDGVSQVVLVVDGQRTRLGALSRDDLVALLAREAERGTVEPPAAG